MSEEEFRFDIDASIRRVTNDAILCSLQEFIVEREPDQLTTLAYDAWPAKVCTAATISKRFGGWRAALGRVGVTTGIQPFEYSVEELLDNLERVWREVGYAKPLTCILRVCKNSIFPGLSQRIDW